MKIVHIQHPTEFRKDEFPKLSIALGFFDGIHRGHQQVIQKAISIAKENNYKSAVMTFDPHPSVVLSKNSGSVKYITPLDDKIKLIAEMNVDYLFIVHFTKEFASLLPEEFVDNYLISIHVKHAICGFDFTYGKFGKGTAETLFTHGKGEFDVTVVEKIKENEQKISSTLIREHIEKGNFTCANHLLGRFYHVKGIVIHGEKRGRTLGYPTANIKIDEQYMIPGVGIYIVKIYINGQWKYGACSVGYNPTFHDEADRRLSVEVFILDFDEEIYGKEVIIEWHKRLRDEKKFSNIEDLKTQIDKDVQQTLHYFAEEQKET